MNLKYMKVSLFEISYKKKWTFSDILIYWDAPQVQDLFVTYTIIQKVLTSSEMWVRSAPWTVQYYRKQHKEYT